MKRLRVSIVVALGALAALAMSLSSAGAGCAQIIGADFDKPFAAGGGGASSATGTTGAMTTTSGSMTSSSVSGSTSTGPGPLCGNGVCDPTETNCNCPGDNCVQAVGDGCCEAPENKCLYPVECADQPEMCGDACCSDTETNATCPQDCPAGCPDATCDTMGGENCSVCAADCPCGGDELCSNGDCKKANGQPCVGASECGSDACVGTDCATGTCMALICCATACADCQQCGADGSGCVDLGSNPACPGNATCVGGLCQCTNGVQEATESAVDCGGDCVGLTCADGMTCVVPEDCTSGVCCDCGANGFLCEPDADCATNCPP